MVASAVLQEAAISGADLLRNLTEVLSAEQARGANLEQTGKTMVAAIAEFNASQSKINRPPGLAKFIGDGWWRNKALWRWKEGMEPQARGRRYVNEVNA